MAAEPQGGKVRQRVVYSGYVQGVCFRAISLDLSRRQEVVGYVRNLPDGTVELEAEGAPSQVEALIKSIAAQFTRNITDTHCTSLSVRGDETRFEIRY